MEKYLGTSIKEVITTFPEVGRILEDYNIGCVPCTLGSCRLKDIVAIHNLPADQEAQLMYRIEKAIYPDREVKKPVGKAVARTAPKPELRYSPPIKRLVDEHAKITNWLELIPAVLDRIDLESEAGRQLIGDGLYFIRNYADKFHHAKEEDILFGYTDKNLEVIQTILQDHETARGHVRAAAEALQRKDRDAVARHLNAYRELLTEHIKKEDEILYPWLERGLSTRQVGELFARFNEAEAKLDQGVIERCERFALEAGIRVRKMERKKEAGR